MAAILHRLALIVLLVGASAAEVRADWLLIPYAGVRFGGSTALIDLDSAADRRTYTFGLSALTLPAGIFGLEADVALVPGFFQNRESPVQLVTSSHVATYGVHLVVSLPLSVTRESLRPYLVIGPGLFRATARDLGRTFLVRSTMPGVTLGAGAMGFISESTGVRFDLRLHRSLGEGDDVLVRPGHRLRYWRATAGLIRRF